MENAVIKGFKNGSYRIDELFMICRNENRVVTFRSPGDQAL
jgi:hypothetical protein